MEKYRQNLKLYLAWRKMFWKSRTVDFIDIHVESAGEKGVFKDKGLNGTGKIIALRRYYRYWISKSRKERNPLAGEFDRLILNFLWKSKGESSMNKDNF